MTSGQWSDSIAGNGASVNSRHVGQPILRNEDQRHLSGHARFVADVRLPRMRDIAFVRSPLAHGMLSAIVQPAGLDPDAIWTAERLEPHVRPLRATLDRPGFRVADQPILAQGKVRYVGELLAAIVGPTRALAEDMAELVVPEIEELPALADVVSALDDAAPRLHDDWESNAYSSAMRVFGDFEAAVQAADVEVRRDFRMARILPHPMETRGCVAHFNQKSRLLTVYLSAQRPHLVRSMLAEQLVGIDETQIRVVVPDVGGGFGGKSNLYPEEVALAAIAMQVPYPVRWIEDRFEHYMASSHARQHVQRLTAYATRAGDLLAVDAKFIVDGGAYSMRSSTASIEAGMAASVLPGPYKLQNYRFETTAVATNKTMVGPYRGVGRPAAVFAMERIMHETAVAIGIEPHAFRRRNMIAAEDHPWTTPTGLRYDTGDYKMMLDDAVTGIDLAAIRAEQSSAPSDRRHVIGVGFGCYTEQTAHGSAEFNQRGSPIDYGFESARVRIDPSGGVVVSTGILSHGQGLETTLAQIAADELGLEPAQIRVRHGDTELCPYGMGTVASRSMVMAGGAVHGAASRMAEKLRRIAANVLEADPSQVRLHDGAAWIDGRTLPFQEIARIAYHQIHRLPAEIEPGLEISFNYRPPVETGAYSGGVHAAKVSVDLDTGEVKLLDFVVAEDCGRVVNPLIVDGQILGGVAQGIGQALYEELRYDDHAQPLTASLAEYLLLGASEVPDIRIHHRETLSPFTLFGMKGVGEGGAIAPPAAIANAVSDALKDIGVDIVELPMRPDRIWSDIQAAGCMRETA